MRHKYIETLLVIDRETGATVRLYDDSMVRATVYTVAMMDTWRFKHAGVWCYCYPTDKETKSGSIIYRQCAD